MRKIISISLSVFFLLVFLISGYKVFNYYSEANKQEGKFARLLEDVENAGENTPATNSEDNNDVMLPEYAKLFEQNNDLVGWIQVEDTKINYPVMQSVHKPNFYLKHGFDKSYSDYGCPYVDESCDVNKPSDNITIYGHHMKNGTMFAGLDKFKKKDFWESHKTIFFDTLYEKQTYEIVAVFKTVVYTDNANAFNYYQFVDAETPEDFERHISRAKEIALYDTGVTAEYGDKLITLSTCEYSNNNGRLVVVAKRVV